MLSWDIITSEATVNADNDTEKQEVVQGKQCQLLKEIQLVRAMEESDNGQKSTIPCSYMDAVIHKRYPHVATWIQY